MARVILENLTVKQAKVFASWYEGQGEQDAGPWFEDRNCEVPITDVSRKGGFSEFDKSTETLTIYCK